MTSMRPEAVYGHHSLQTLLNYAANDSLRYCLADGVQSYLNVTVQQHAWTFRDAGSPWLSYYFPGLFVRREEVADVPFAAQPFPVGVRQSGLPNHTWVEIVRVGRIDDKDVSNERSARATVGQVWFWLAPGSGIWLNTGRTLVINEAWTVPVHNKTVREGVREMQANLARPLGDWWIGERLRGGLRKTAFWDNPTCEQARIWGYDTLQMTSSFLNFSYEIVDCRGAGFDDADRTWVSACPPPHIELMHGLPTPRLAPAIAHADGPASACVCNHSFNFLNCKNSTGGQAP